MHQLMAAMRYAVQPPEHALGASQASFGASIRLKIAD